MRDQNSKKWDGLLHCFMNSACFGFCKVSNKSTKARLHYPCTPSYCYDWMNLQFQCSFTTPSCPAGCLPNFKSAMHHLPWGSQRNRKPRIKKPWTRWRKNMQVQISPSQTQAIGSMSNCGQEESRRKASKMYDRNPFGVDCEMDIYAPLHDALAGYSNMSAWYSRANMSSSTRFYHTWPKHAS